MTQSQKSWINRSAKTCEETAKKERKNTNAVMVFLEDIARLILSTKIEVKRALLMKMTVEASLNAGKQHTTAKVIGFRRLMPSLPQRSINMGRNKPQCAEYS